MAADQHHQAMLSGQSIDIRLGFWRDPFLGLGSEFGSFVGSAAALPDHTEYIGVDARAAEKEIAVEIYRCRRASLPLLPERIIPKVTLIEMDLKKSYAGYSFIHPGKLVSDEDRMHFALGCFSALGMKRIEFECRNAALNMKSSELRASERIANTAAKLGHILSMMYLTGPEYYSAEIFGELSIHVPALRRQLLSDMLRPSAPRLLLEFLLLLAPNTVIEMLGGTGQAFVAGAS